MLIPMYLLIGIWGSAERIRAAVKFFIYTMAGSLLMFLAILYLYQHTGTFGIEEIYKSVQDNPLGGAAGMFCFLAFALSFAIKVPLFPVHTWLPDAHTEAPTAGSVILAGVLLKLGVVFCFIVELPAAFMILLPHRGTRYVVGCLQIVEAAEVQPEACAGGLVFVLWMRHKERPGRRLGL